MQLGFQQVPFGKGSNDRLPPFVELGQLGKAVADGGDLDFIQQAGRLLPVAGDKRYRGPRRLRGWPRLPPGRS